MIPEGLEVFLLLDTVDLRWGFDRLSGVVQEQMGRDVRSRALFVFLGRRRTGAKVLYYDGTGLCLFYKRLDRGAFRFPVVERGDEPYVEVEERVLLELLDGLHVDPKPPARKKPVVH